MKAVIYKSTGNLYLVKDESGAIWNCRMRGRLKIDKTIASTNPVAVGDWVNVDIEDEEQRTGVIYGVESRQNYIVRSSPHNRNQKHIIAANLDIAVLIATIAEPRTSQGFIDRFLVTAEAYHIPAVIVFNKSDLHVGEIADLYEHQKSIFESIGYPVLAVSIKNEKSIHDLKLFLKDKTSLFSGHSGVGKSTLINQLIPDVQLRTAEVSKWSGKGQHTTTFAEMFDLPFGGRVIDTPGIKELGLVNFDQYELAHYFPEMRALIHNCKFNNCIHIDEPGCAIKAAIANDQIAIERYESYLSMIAEL